MKSSISAVALILLVSSLAPANMTCTGGRNKDLKIMFVRSGEGTQDAVVYQNNIPVLSTQVTATYQRGAIAASEQSPWWRSRDGKLNLQVDYPDGNTGSSGYASSFDADTKVGKFTGITYCIFSR